jgi:phosphatidate cytidylyltransferase
LVLFCKKEQKERSSFLKKRSKKFLFSSAEPRWRDLGLRVASALVLAPAGVAAIWLGGVVWLAVVTLIVAGMGVEWALLCRGRPWINLAWGMLYILPSYVALILLRGAESGRATVLFLMLVVWAGDIGAYLVGRLVGGPRLAPSISPGKTWSGAAGGTLCAVLAGLAVAPAHPVAACVLALVLSIVAQAGDLLESAIKRHFGVKDSGRLIPGHGGLLDRLDGVVAAAPAMLLISFLTRYG